MIAIGWTRTAGETPYGIHRTRAGTLDVLSCHRQPMRGVIGLQSKCWDAGLDFVPVAPSQNLDIAQALVCAEQLSMRQQVDMLVGLGQLTLSLRMPPSKSATQSGRSWLMAAKVRHVRFANQATYLTDMTDDLGLPRNNIRHVGDAARCDVRVGRQMAKATVAQIDDWCNDASGEIDGPLTVTGPWPPFGFVRALADMQVAA